MTATQDLNINKKSLQFLEILNKQDSSIQYTTEFQNNQMQLNFLYTNITNNGTNSYEFKILKKLAITNAQIKPFSNMTPNISIAVFTGFLSRAYKICSKSSIAKKFQFFIEVFTKNGYEKRLLKRYQKII